MTRPSRVSAPRRIVAVLALALALCTLLALAWWAYHPGLSGDFLFDDFSNLPALGATGPVDNWATFWRYITSGTADPTGRPLTLLTFLIDANNWPAKPYPFKVTNVILHLINGVLLFCVLWRLGRALLPRGHRYSDRTPVGAAEAANPSGLPASTSVGAAAAATRENLVPALAALFGAGAWLLHPLFISTTLYIVQREAMLPATFVLIGMLGWIASRETLMRGNQVRGWIGMALSAWLCTGLAVLSKANGALLPLLLLLVEWIVLSRQPLPDPAARRRHRYAVTIFLGIPSALVLAYLLYLLPGAIRGTFASRGWTVGERLLTEARVVTDYLRLLVVPHAQSSGLFNDAFRVSTGWLRPASTLPCVLLILALIGTGFALRKRHPAIALALLFYFTAQLMESGWIPLELYYEHRNYLPAMLLFWPIGLGLANLRSLRWPALAVALCILLALTLQTRQRATLWGDGLRQAQVWAAINPDSARAQTNAALYDKAHDRPRLAAARLQLSLPKHPDDIQAPINLIGAECMLGQVDPATLAAAERALRNARAGGQTTFTWFGSALAQASRNDCKGLDFAALQGLLDAARANPMWRAIAGRQQDFDHLQGELDFAEGKPEATLIAFNHALAARPEPGVALEQAAFLGARGQPQLGLKHLDYYATLPPGPAPGRGMPRIHAWVLQLQDYWPRETARLRRNLAADAARRAADAAK